MVLANTLDYLRGTILDNVSSPVYLLFLAGLLIGPLLILLSEVSSIRAKTRQPVGLRRLGLIGHTNMRDQYDAKYTIPPLEPGTRTDPTAHTTGPMKVKALFVHPIKSCAPLELNRALMTETGFAYDRIFALAEELDGRNAEGKADPSLPKRLMFRSQRTNRLMSQIKSQVWVPRDDANPDDPLVQAGGCLQVSFPKPGKCSLVERLGAIVEALDLSAFPQIHFTVPIAPTEAQIKHFNLQRRQFTIHAEQVMGLDMSGFKSVSTALPAMKQLLEIRADHNLYLMARDPTFTRLTEDNLAPADLIGYTAAHDFTDEQPLNLNSISSVHAVSTLLPPANRPLNALRYRANIWFSGAPAYAEERWSRVRINPRSAVGGPRAPVAPTLSLVCRNLRCLLPNVDPESGVRDRREPNNTMIANRRVDPGAPKKACLGMHCVAEGDSFRGVEGGKGVYVAVGDEIEVVATGEHVFGATARRLPLLNG